MNAMKNSLRGLTRYPSAILGLITRGAMALEEHRLARHTIDDRSRSVADA